MYWWFTVFKSYSPGLISVITFSSRSWRTLRSEISSQAATAFEVYAFKNRTPFLLCPNWSHFFFFSPYPFIFYRVGSGNEIFKIISGQVLGVAVPAVLPDRRKNLLNVVHNVCDFVVFCASVRVNLKFSR